MRTAAHWVRFLCVSAVVAVLSPGRADAQLSSLVERCAAAESNAHDTVNFCQRALATGQLNTQAEAQVRTNLAIGFYELARYTDARVELDQAIASQPDLTLAYLYRARALERLGRLSDAAGDYATVLRRDPGAWEAFLGRGEMLLNNGDAAAAERDFSAVLRLQPGMVGAHFNRGAARYQLGAWAGAAADFQAVIEATPLDAAAHLNLAQSRGAAGDAGAETVYDKAISLAPEWARAWFARGVFFESQDRREEANRDFMRAYELGFSDPWLNERVRQIRGG